MGYLNRAQEAHVRKTVLLALITLVAGYCMLPESGRCHPTNRWAYARSPFPDEWRAQLRLDTAAELRQGCFDGRKWTETEIQTALR
jgi:hypothetical protein